MTLLFKEFIEKYNLDNMEKSFTLKPHEKIEFLTDLNKIMKETNLKRKNVPLYFQLEQILKSQIMTGELLSGDQIPTEKELAEKYNVSSITVRQAILNLVSEGLLNRKQGRGTFVTDTQPVIKNIPVPQ